MNHFRGVWAKLVITALLSCACVSAWSWGSEGHRLVAAIAQTDLTAKTQAKVGRILQGESLEDASTWMDEVRSDHSLDYMKGWHYTRIEVCQPPHMQCQNGNCAVSKTQWALRALHSKDADERKFALRVLVHLVGDMHQPLHSADNEDAGGNAVHVLNRRCKRDGCDLHTYWDSYLVQRITHGRNTQAIAQRLKSSEGPLPANDPANPESWALESNKLAREVAYRTGAMVCGHGSDVNLTPQYDEEATQVVALQLTKAGLRLARLLNQELDR